VNERFATLKTDDGLDVFLGERLRHVGMNLDWHRAFGHVAPRSMLDIGRRMT
jgi:hypothetical protein